MKRFFSILTAAAMMAVIGAPAMAQEGQTIVERKGNTTSEIQFAPASANHDINTQMLNDFSQLQDNDPAVARAIARHPDIVNNPRFVQRHPALQTFLDNYPDAREEIIDNPGNFVVPTRGAGGKNARDDANSSDAAENNADIPGSGASSYTTTEMRTEHRTVGVPPSPAENPSE